MSFFDNFEEALDFALSVPSEFVSVRDKEGNIWMFNPKEMILARVKP